MRTVIRSAEYVRGYFDGEGCVHYEGKPKPWGRSGAFIIATSDLDVMGDLVDTMGAWDIAYGYHIYPPRGDGKRDIGTLRVKQRASIGSGAPARAELLVVVARRDAVFERDAGGQARGDLARVHRAATFLGVVMRACAARQDPEAVAERADVRGEGVGDAALEPAQATG